MESVARSDKGCRKICRQMRYVLKNKELDKSTNREVNDE